MEAQIASVGLVVLPFVLAVVYGVVMYADKEARDVIWPAAAVNFLGAIGVALVLAGGMFVVTLRADPIDPLDPWTEQIVQPNGTVPWPDDPWCQIFWFMGWPGCWF